MATANEQIRLEDLIGKEIFVVETTDGEDEMGVVRPCGFTETNGTLVSIQYDENTKDSTLLTLDRGLDTKDIDISRVKPLPGAAIYYEVRIYNNKKQVISFYR